MNRNRPHIDVLLFFLFALVSLGVLGCHDGALGGEGAPCTVDTKPCRAFFTCISGRCQRTDGGHDDGRKETSSTPLDTGDDRSDGTTESVGEGAFGGELQSDASVDREGSPDTSNDVATSGDTSADFTTKPSPDAAADGSDGATPVQNCDRSKPFGNVTLVGGISGSGGLDLTARLSPDELNIYFASTRDGKYSIYEATRSTRDADFTTPSRVANIGSTAVDLAPTVTADGLTMYIESNRSSMFAIYTATRSRTDLPWPALEPFSELMRTPTIFEGGPFIMPKGDVLYFQSTRAPDGLLHVHEMKRAPGGAWSAPKLTTGFTINDEFSPVATDDGLTLFFATDRTAPDDYDIWMARRASTEVAFGSPEVVQGVNTGLGETPNWISPDSCRLYFARRDSTVSRIYVGSRPAGNPTDDGPDGDASPD